MNGSRRAAVASIAALLVSGAIARAAADPVTLDVVVVDTKARPIGDLRPSDVELTDSGDVRPVEAIAAAPGGQRVVGIFLDEFHVRRGDSTERARAALLRMLDTQLREGDLIAIAKPLDPLHAIAFTEDRAVVRNAIAAFEGHAGDYTPRSEFERNFMSRDPKTADATRAQVVSAALQALSRRLGEQRAARKVLIFVSEGFRPVQPRAIIYAANRNGVALQPIDPAIAPNEYESMLRSMAEQTGGVASINESDLAPALSQALGDLDHHLLVTFSSTAPEDGRFHPVQIRVKRPGTTVRSRSGYWTAVPVATTASSNASRRTLPFRPAHSSPYIRPWIGMTRGLDGKTSVTVTWEPGVAPPRNQRVAAVTIKAMGSDGAILFEHRIGAGDADRAVFDAPPGPIGLEMAIHSTSGAALDTDYRGLSVPDLAVTKPTIATPQVLRTRTARQFAEVSTTAEPVPVASRTFSRTERLIVRVPAYTAGSATPVVSARLLNRRGTPMRELQKIDAPLPPDLVQFDLPLASLAPDEYRVEVTAANPTEPRDEARELISIRVTN